MFSQKVFMLYENDFLKFNFYETLSLGRDNYLVLLLLGVLYIYTITIVYQQSREQKRVGPTRPGLP